MNSYGSTTDTSSNNAHSIYHATNSESHNTIDTTLDMNEVIMLISVILNSMAAGIIIIFSNTIMPALSKQDLSTGIGVMNTINVIIVNPLFIIIFFGGLISVFPTVSLLRKKDNNSNSNPVAGYYALASTLIYFFGQFLVTVTQNVPRNNQLAEYSDETYWAQDYLISWVNWNTFRGVSALVSAVLGAMSLTLMRR